MNKVGAYFRNAADSVDDPSSTYWIGDLNLPLYVAPVSDLMSCTLINQNTQALTQQIEYWLNKLNSSNLLEQPNLSKVYAVQKAKLNDYLPYSYSCAYQVEESVSELPDTDPSLSPSSAPTSGTGSNNMLLLVGLGVGLFIWSRSKKNKRRRR
jgi:hypothetical protein